MDLPGLTLVRMSAAGTGRPLLVLGPSLGTAVETLWGECAALLSPRFEIVGWELPGHGDGAPARAPFSVAGLAAQIVARVAELCGVRRFAYAGDSIGGAVGLALLLDHGDHLAGATLACTGARIGTEQAWRDRAALVRRTGIEAVVDSSLSRWFAPGFTDRRPAATTALVAGLRAVDEESYARTCEALAGFDVRARLPRIRGPVTVVAGAEDVATPVGDAREIADAVRGAGLVVLDQVGHLAPVEAPEALARIVDATADLAEGAPARG